MSPDGSLLATASEDSSWKMFDASSGRELLAVAGHDGQGACICPMDEEGQRAEVIASCTRNGHARGVIDVAFSPCGQRIATAGGENEVMIWSAFTGEEELRLDMPWFKCTSAISVTFSPDASRIATGSDDERICVWNARNGELIHTILHAHVGSVESLCFSPDGLSLASVGGDDGCGKIWDAASGAPLRELEDKRGDDSACVKFAPDGRFLAAGSTAGSVTLWDVATGEEALCLSAHTGRHGCICTLHFGEDEEGDMTVVHDAACPHVGHRDPAWSVCFAPDGDALFSSSDDGTVKCWDAATGALRRTLVVGAQNQRQLRT
ncbi:WD40-repeat-containing domain protein [Baffinella frigidus]|nr:WD40-repeat-containing domain protein [Cryptophyta sp. CCMP2293]